MLFGVVVSGLVVCRLLSLVSRCLLVGVQPSRGWDSSLKEVCKMVVWVWLLLESLGSASAQGGGSSPEEVGIVVGGAASAQGRGTSP